MKDRWRFCWECCQGLLAVNLVQVLFVPIMGYYESTTLVRWVVMGLLAIAGMAILVFEGIARGDKDKSSEKRLLAAHEERGIEIGPEERAKFFRPSKAFFAAFVAYSPTLLVGVFLTVQARIGVETLTNAYIGTNLMRALFFPIVASAYMSDPMATPVYWYFVQYVLYAALIVLGYYIGPTENAKIQKIIAKNNKRRARKSKVNDRR